MLGTASSPTSTWVCPYYSIEGGDDDAAATATDGEEEEEEEKKEEEEATATTRQGQVVGRERRVAPWARQQGGGASGFFGKSAPFSLVFPILRTNDTSVYPDLPPSFHGKGKGGGSKGGRKGKGGWGGGGGAPVPAHTKAYLLAKGEYGDDEKAMSQGESEEEEARRRQ